MQRTEAEVSSPSAAAIPQQVKPTRFQRAVRLTGMIASATWNGIKFVAKAIENPAVLTFSAIGAATAFYGTGDIITQNVGPSLALLAAPITGAVLVIAVKFRPARESAAAVFKTLNRLFDHVKNVFSRAGAHYLYLNRIARTISGGPLNTAGAVIIPVTAFSTAVLAHMLNENLKNKDKPNMLLLLLSCLLIKPIDYGSALSPVFYVFGPENSGLLDSSIILYSELGLTGVGLINETFIQGASKKARHVVESGFEVMRSASRSAYILSTVESMDALANNDNVALGQLIGTSTALIVVELPIDAGITLRQRKYQYQQLKDAEEAPLLINEHRAEPPVSIDNVTWSLPRCSQRAAHATLFQARVENAAGASEKEQLTTDNSVEQEDQNPENQAMKNK